MKFGKTLVSHQIPEWSVYYMNYKHLKKTIKTIDQFINYHSYSDQELPELISTVLSQFFFELDRDIEKVSGFYDAKYTEYSRRTARIEQVLGYTDGKITHQVDSADELDEIVSILLELRTIYRNLKWFGELNHKGFVKILKKLDKKLLYLSTLANDHLRGTDAEPVCLPTNNKENYLTTRVNALPFANEAELITGLDKINDILNQLSDQQVPEESGVAGVTKSVQMLKVASVADADVERFHRLIRNDDSAALDAELGLLQPSPSVKLVISLLNKATLANAIACIDLLFARLVDNGYGLSDPADISGRNFFHQHVVLLGKKQLIKEQKQAVPGESQEIHRLYGNESGPDGSQLLPVHIDGLLRVLGKVEQIPELRLLLVARDGYLRTPIHYAAQYGIKDVTRVLLERLSLWSLLDPTVPVDSVSAWGDQEGLTPLHLAVIGRHPKTTELLLSFSAPLSCPNLILLAARLGCDEIVRLLAAHVDVDYTDAENNGETALYIAAKQNRPDLVKFLLDLRANTELGECVFGWTPIFVAGAEGYTEVVQELLDCGARYDEIDDSGWLPMEHAALRGHLGVADLLKPDDPSVLLYDIDSPSKLRPGLGLRTSSALNLPFMHPANEDSLLLTSSIDKLPEQNRHAVSEVYRQFKQLDGSSVLVNVPASPETLSMTVLRSRLPVNRRKMKPIKLFGHRYLTHDELLVLVTLGTTDLRDTRAAVDLDKILAAKSFVTELDTALLLVVTCRNRTTGAIMEAPVVVDLPLEDHHGSAADPLTFKVSGLPEVFVTFDLVPTYQYPIDLGRHKILGRGVAILESVYTNVGPHLRLLHNSITVPLLLQELLEVLGTLRFEYLCVNSFSHPHMSITRSDTYWKQLVSTRVIGHRGLGKNVSNRKSLQLGENTVELFIAAASLGASYVEFDVQLTKDFVPVVYHDFLVAESGVDIPMHAMTAEQFLGLSEDRTKKAEASKDRKFAMDDELLGKYNRPRSMSSYPSAPNFLTTAEDEDLDREFRDQISRRMKLTKTWKEKGFKGNARGLSVASNFVTLKELFKRLPKNVGFNMELKYPMLDEAQQESMGEVAFDMNFYVDTILKTVYDENLTGRDILFSSFHPDICVLLSLKQPTMPILFLTEAGTAEMADIRALSLQNAIRFAKKWNLLGIVSAAQTLVKTPRLAQVVKSSGLVCVTYGLENNDPELCKIQMKAGVDAVIADSVLAVREGLRKDDDKDDDLSSL